MSGGGDRGTVVDPTIEITTSKGETAALRLSDVTLPRPVLASSLWKLPGLGERHLPDEPRTTDTERFMHSYAIPLSRFGLSSLDCGCATLGMVTLRFEGAGSAYLDDIGLEPPVD